MTMPRGLKTAGRNLWGDVTKEFDLSVAELRLLEHACRELDLIGRIDKELAAGDLFVAGYKGQPVHNPLLTEIRQHRNTFASLMNKLDLPAEEGAVQNRSASARSLANARWGRGA